MKGNLSSRTPLLGVTAAVIIILFNSLGYTQSQIYQKAKVPLRAVTLQEVGLRSDTGKSSLLATLRLNETVLIQGRKGTWFQVLVRTQGRDVVGWVPSVMLRVVGPAEMDTAPIPAPISPMEKAVVEPAPESPPKRTLNNRASRDAFRRPSKPYRLIPYAGYAYGAKSIESQYRFGTDLLFSAWPATEVGGTIEIGVKDFVLVSAGPELAHEVGWPRFGSLRFMLRGALPFSYVSTPVGSDKLFGVRVGLDATYPMTSSDEFELSLLARVSADMIIFGTSAVQVPVLFGSGIVFRF